MKILNINRNNINFASGLHSGQIKFIKELDIKKLTEKIKAEDNIKCDFYNNRILAGLSKKTLDIFDNLESKNLTFCYDCGHDNFLTPGSKLVEKYGHLLTTTHLHDNHGKADEHMTLGMGAINQEELAKKLAKCNFEYLSAEVREPDPNQTLTEDLEKNLKALNKLDKLIEKYKQNNQETSK